MNITLGHYNITALTIIIVGLSIGLKYVISKIDFLKNRTYLIPSIISIIGLILYVINNFAWNIRPINPLLIDVPIIKGNYEGKVDIMHTDTSLCETGDITAKIQQTGSSIYIDVYSKKGSHSSTIMADLKEINGIWYLYHIYQNENHAIAGNINRYEGIAKYEVLFDSNRTELKGRFYTDESRKSFGTVYLIKEKAE